MKWSRLVLLTLLVMATVTVSTAAKKPPSCVAAAEWVRTHPDEIPRTLAGLSKYNMNYRRAIFDVLPNDIQKTLWVEHLRNQLGKEEFTPAQREVVEWTIAHVPAMYAEASLATSGTRTIKELDKLIAEKFANDVELGRRTFVQLGGEVPAAAEAELFNCSCNSDGIDWCNSITGPVETCVRGGVIGCYYKRRGCGNAWLEECDGHCVISSGGSTP